MRHDSHYVDEIQQRRTHRSEEQFRSTLSSRTRSSRAVEIGDLTELSDSIKEKGVLEPLLVKPNPKAGN